MPLLEKTENSRHTTFLQEVDVMETPTVPGPRPLPDWLARSGDAAEDAMQYLARHSHSFRYAARYLPPPLDRRVAEMYAFCRFTDDLVDRADADESPAALRIRLHSWRTLAEAAHAGYASGLPLLDRAMGEMGRRGIPFKYASELIEGVGMDLAPRRYADWEDLEVYAYRVASVVGLWMTELAGEKDPWMLERAADLGAAMQITNIARDVGEDWRGGRLYLPLDLLARHEIGDADLDRLASGGADAALKARWSAVMEAVMERAEALYARALPAIFRLPEGFRRPILVSALVYRDIHTALRKNGCENFARRARTTLPRKMWLGLRAQSMLRAAGAGRKVSLP